MVIGLSIRIKSICSWRGRQVHESSGVGLRGIKAGQQFVGPASCALATIGELRGALRRQADDIGAAVAVGAWRSTSLSAASRSMMPVTLPFDTINRRDSSVMFMPVPLPTSLRAKAAITSNCGSVIANSLRSPVAQFDLDAARGAQRP